MTTKDDLLEHCWVMFDYFFSREYQGAMDERFSKLTNGMFIIVSEIGRPKPKFDSFGKQFYSKEKNNE